MSGGGHLPLDEARAAVLRAAQRLESETVETGAALGRVLAEQVTSATDLPPFDNSAMDGFAVRAEDTATAGDKPAELTLVGESRAGHPAELPLGAGEAMRISTGAAMPDGADAVLRVEDAAVDGERVIASHALGPGTDVRPAGDDVGVGEAVLEAGRLLGPGDLAMALGAGRSELAVTRRPRVSVVATGDELVPAGQPLGPGQIHESNSTMLAALAAAHGAAVGTVLSRVADESGAVDAAIGSGMQGADVLVLCGGVSVGEHDHVKPALERAGVEQVFWQVALRPGHPTWFGLLARDSDRPPVLVFGLPGNPVSAYVTFLLFVAPALGALSGRLGGVMHLNARYAGPPVNKRAGFAHVLRCTLSDDHGELVAQLTSANQRSHALASLVASDCLGIVPESVTELVPGDNLRIELSVGQYT